MCLRMLEGYSKVSTPILLSCRDHVDGSYGVCIGKELQVELGRSVLMFYIVLFD